MSSYIGRNVDKISNVEVLDNITFDGSSSYTLQKNSVNFTPSSANTLLVSIDGVVQAGNFTVSGSTIDFGTAVAGTSTCDFILHYGIGLITTPADGTVTTAKIGSNAVTTAKIADANVTSAKMFSGFANGITEADQWRLTADTNQGEGGAVVISTNWERNDSSGFNYIGTGLTESSGVFTFPSTGFYLIIHTAQFSTQNGNTNPRMILDVTLNNSTYSNVSIISGGNKGTGDINTTGSSQYLLDVTDTVNVKIRFSSLGFASLTKLVGNTSYQTTGFTVLRLGDT